MLEITIVDDNLQFLNQLVEMLNRYAKENNEEFSFKKYSSSSEFLKEKVFSPIVFLDIVMPGCSGLDLAKFIRENDENCVIVFVTTMAQYAINGYEFSALDFIVKPVEYETLSFKMPRIIENALKRANSKITLNVNYDVISIDISSIYYLESGSHKVIYHTEKGNYEVWTSLAKESEHLLDKGFAYCNSCYLVNLRHVKAISDEMVKVDKEELKISRSKKKEFTENYIRYIG